MKTFASSVIQGGLELNPVTSNSSFKDMLVNQIANNVNSQITSLTSGQNLDVDGIKFREIKPDYRDLLSRFDFTQEVPKKETLKSRSIVHNDLKSSILADIQNAHGENTGEYIGHQITTIENDFKWAQGIFNTMNFYRGGFKDHIGVLADSVAGDGDDPGDQVYTKDEKGNKGEVIGVEYDSVGLIPQKGKYTPSLFNPMYGLIGGSITDNVPIIDDADISKFNSFTLNAKAAKYLSDCSIETLVNESRYGTIELRSIIKLDDIDKENVMVYDDKGELSKKDQDKLDELKNQSREAKIKSQSNIYQTRWDELEDKEEKLEKQINDLEKKQKNDESFSDNDNEKLENLKQQKQQIIDQKNSLDQESDNWVASILASKDYEDEINRANEQAANWNKDNNNEGVDDAIPLAEYVDQLTSEAETVEYYPSVLGAAKYKYADFMYCKDLGKVSNNHLITLRKFSLPIGDDINFNIGRRSDKLHDVARLITWFGTEDNKLESIMTYDYEATWKEFNSEREELPSQEDDSQRGVFGTIANLTSNTYNKQQLAGIALNPWSRSILGRFGAEPTYAGNPVMTGQKYDKNKIYEPANTIRSTHKYDGNLKFNHEFSLKFCYKLRSYDNINPKSAFLDLLGNILVMTYRKGNFWPGERSIYGPTTNRNTWNKANSFFDAFQNKVLDIWSGFIGGGFDFGKLIGGIADGLKSGFNAVKSWFETGAYKQLIGNISTGVLCGILGGMRNKLGRPAVYAFSSMLDGKNVGLWHVTIGNPKNPIASFGNLILTKSKITHTGPLGIDDFPTELIVEVSLKHARPRDMEEIQRMYTRGQRAIYYAYSSLESDAPSTQTGINQKYGKKNDGSYLTKEEAKKQGRKLRPGHTIRTKNRYYTKPRKAIHAKRYRDEHQ